jgi:phosphate transport system permease protein
MTGIQASPTLVRSASLYRRRKLMDRFMTATMIAAVALAVVSLFLILFYLVKEGLPGVNWALITEEPNRPGKPGGGVHNSIIGSAIMVGLALAIGVPIAVGCGIFLVEYGQNRVGSIVRFLI